MTKNNKLYPSIFKMITNFTKELGTYVANGTPNVTEEDYKDRLETCLECPSLKRDVMRCKTCGCTVENKAKWKTTSCPENKWKEQNVKE
tara:strand:+ start:270 stop:536 length:267 start_codon:yes stop_codon:yes gene_type:complete